MSAKADMLAALTEIRTQLAELKGLLPPARTDTPTFEAFIPAALAACSEASRAVYEPQLAWAAAALGGRRVDAVSGQELAALCKQREVQARKNPRARHGRCAAEHLVGALRLFFGQVVLAGHLQVSPAAGLRRPRRPRGQRRDLEAEELAELFAAAVSTSDDPELDELILATARETAARREGVLGIELGDLDRRRAAIHLREKFRDERDAPASIELLDALAAHAAARGARLPSDRVLRYADGHPVTSRRLDGLFARVRAELAWADRLGVSLHWLRHTTLSDVERVAGPRVARAYAGHAPGEVTDRYTHVSFQDLSEAHRLIFAREDPTL